MATQAEFNQFVMDKLEAMDGKLKELEAKDLLLSTMATHHAQIIDFLIEMVPILDKSNQTRLQLMFQRQKGEIEKAQQVVKMFTSKDVGHA